MQQELEREFGKQGGPGSVEIIYVSGLCYGEFIDAKVGEPGKGGKGGDPAPEESVKENAMPYLNQGGAGGGRENIPLIEAFKLYAEKMKATKYEPLCFLEPGGHCKRWQHKQTDTATVVIINPGGGGGGGAGNIVEGEAGEYGIRGATFVFPTYLVTQRPSR